jgi:hypothetical protein
MTSAEIFAVLKGVMPGRAFRKLAPMGTHEPYVIFNRTLSTPQNSLCGYMQTDLVRYQIDSYAITDAEAQLNMERVIAALRACDDPPLVESQQDSYEEVTRIHRTMAMITTWFEPARAAR